MTDETLGLVDRLTEHTNGRLWYSPHLGRWMERDIDRFRTVPLEAVRHHAGGWLTQSRTGVLDRTIARVVRAAQDDLRFRLPAEDDWPAMCAKQGVLGKRIRWPGLATALSEARDWRGVFGWHVGRKRAVVLRPVPGRDRCAESPLPVPRWLDDIDGHYIGNWFAVGTMQRIGPRNLTNGINAAAKANSIRCDASEIASASYDYPSTSRRA